MLIFSPFPSILNWFFGVPGKYDVTPFKNLERWPPRFGDLWRWCFTTDPIGIPTKNRDCKFTKTPSFPRNGPIIEFQDEMISAITLCISTKSFVLTYTQASEPPHLLRNQKQNLLHTPNPSCPQNSKRAWQSQTLPRQEARMPRSDRPWWELKRFKKEILG